MHLLLKVTSGCILSFFLSFSCGQDIAKNTLGNTSDVTVKKDIQNLIISKPANNDLFTIGQELLINYYFKDSLRKVDSVLCWINGLKFSQQNKPFHSFLWETGQELPGVKNITLIAYYSDNTIESQYSKISLLSDLKPQLYTIKVSAVYPHDITAYTQGLLYEDGFLYEGTGQTGQSTLRKVKLETGESIKVLNLPPDIFGEGVASVGNYLYQLTYKNNIAYTYDKNTFELVNKFNFPMKEGWGLTYDGKNLLMTDGTENIYSIDPQYFTEIKHIAVYDDTRPINNLNELEFINNEIWANIYTTDTIVRIDPGTGKVTGKIVVKDILMQEDYHPNINYLNGIAYDKEKDRIFITGKNWPKLFEIKLVKK